MRLLTETFKLLSTNVPINVRSLLSVSLINSTRLISPASNKIAALSKNYYFVAPSVWNKVINDSKFKIKVSFSDTLIHTFKNCSKSYLLELQSIGSTHEWSDNNFFSYKSAIETIFCLILYSCLLGNFISGMNELGDF